MPLSRARSSYFRALCHERPHPPIPPSPHPPTPPHPQVVRQTKLMIAAQQKRIAAQQATGVQQAPGGGFRLGGDETVLIPAPGAYPTSLSRESAECLHQGLRVVYVLAQYMPKYLEVSW